MNDKTYGCDAFFFNDIAGLLASWKELFAI